MDEEGTAGRGGADGEGWGHLAALRSAAVLDFLDRKGLSDFEVCDPGLLSR